MTVLLWTLDTGDFPAAYPMAEHALKHGWVTPDQYQRQTACMVAEEVADTALKQLAAGTFEALDSLMAFAGLLTDQDMPDQVRARLHKALGLAQTESQPQEALAQFQRALQLDGNVGVKKLIEQLERQIRNSLHNAPKSLALQQGGNRTNPDELTQVSDSGDECSQRRCSDKDEGDTE